VPALLAFEELMLRNGYALATRKRYGEAAARFLDYLIELEALGVAVSQDHLNRIIGVYPAFLIKGPEIGQQIPDALPQELKEVYKRAAAYAGDIRFPGMAHVSATPALAAVNLFLELARDIAKAGAPGGGSAEAAECEPLQIEAIEGSVPWRQHEVRRFEQSSVFAAVVRFNRSQLKRPKRLRAAKRKQSIQVDEEKLDFPLEHLRAVLDAAGSWRDRVYWLGQVAAGLRQSEMLNLQVEDVDPKAGAIRVQDPHGRRYLVPPDPALELRFKGRKMAETFLFEPLKTEFFEALRMYVRQEYVPMGAAGHRFLLQKIDGEGVGSPFVTASDAARSQAFKAAVQRAQVPSPPGRAQAEWTQHSLRHAYGVYMLNHIPVPGGFGLRLSEVQMLMGHADPKSTAHYARQDRELLRTKLLAADMLTLDSAASVTALPRMIASRLRAEAERLEKGKQSVQ
jgi:integrase